MYYSEDMIAEIKIKDVNGLENLLLKNGEKLTITEEIEEVIKRYHEKTTLKKSNKEQLSLHDAMIRHPFSYLVQMLQVFQSLEKRCKELDLQEEISGPISRIVAYLKNYLVKLDLACPVSTP